MILDHGVRTLYENRLRSGYELEKDGKYDLAFARYNDALMIAKSYDDDAGIRQCENIISHLNNVKNKKNNDELTF